MCGTTGALPQGPHALYLESGKEWTTSLPLLFSPSADGPSPRRAQPRRPRPKQAARYQASRAVRQQARDGRHPCGKDRADSPRPRVSLRTGTRRRSRVPAFHLPAGPTRGPHRRNPVPGNGLSPSRRGIVRLRTASGARRAAAAHGPGRASCRARPEMRMIRSARRLDVGERSPHGSLRHGHGA